MAGKSSKWAAFPHDAKGFAYAGDALKKAWPALHAGDNEPYPDVKRAQSLLDAAGKAAKGLTPDKIPTMMNYTTLLNADSMYNTPPCWCIYMTGLVMNYLENEIGGLENMQKRNAAKAKVLYDYLDGQDFFQNPVEHRYRSTMNVTFTSPNADLDKKFCAEAAEAGFVNLKGHRLVGGMRASIYNAMPPEGIDKLVDFMEKFRKENA